MLSGSLAIQVFRPRSPWRPQSSEKPSFLFSSFFYNTPKQSFPDMQFPHVFIAFLAREVRFPHGFIAFSLFIFLGGPRWPPRAIFSDFGRPLGASWGYLGAILAPTRPSWLHLGALLGLSWRIFGHLGAILAPYLLQLGHPGSILALSWAYLGMSLASTLTIWMSKSRKSEPL